MYNLIPIDTITHKNDLYRGHFFGTPFYRPTHVGDY